MSLTATQEGIKFGPFDAVGEKCGKKAPRRCPVTVALCPPPPSCQADGGMHRLEPLPLPYFLLSYSHWACREATFTPRLLLLCITLPL